MLKRSLLPIHETVSILFLAIFANQLFSIHIDFSAPFDLVVFFKTIVLLFASIIYSITITNLKKLNEKSIEEYYSSTIDERVKNPLDEIFKKKLKNKHYRHIYLSILFVVIFFLTEPLYDWLCN